MILINNLHFKSRKLTLIHTDENPHEKGFERQWSPLKDKNLFLLMICKFFFWSWHRDYLLSSNKCETNIISLISMCNNVTLYWRHWRRRLHKSSINILSFIRFAWIKTFYSISYLRLSLWCNIALRNPFL